MEMNDKLAKVICDLEYEIGSKCYNSHSYDGWNHIQGRSFRYPVVFPYKNGKEIKITDVNFTHVLNDKYITVENVKLMKYCFGANELFIGKGLIAALSYLEDRYGIDFAALEEQHQQIEQ